MSLLSTRLPYINGDKGNWGEILNGWLKSIGGYAGHGNGYGTNNPSQANNAGLNFATSDPTASDLGLSAIPTGFTYINTESNQIRRWTGSNWQILLQAGGTDTYVTSGTTQQGGNFTNQIRLTRNDNQVISFDYLPSFQGNAGRFLRINQAGNNLEWAAVVTPATDIYVNGGSIINGNTLRLTRNNAGNIDIDLTSLNIGQDHDWYVTGGTSIPNNIAQNIYTRGRVGIGDHFGTAAATQPGGHDHFLEVRSAGFPLGLYVSSDLPVQPSFVGLYRRRDSGNGAVQNGDFISGIYSYGYNGSSYEFLTLIQSVASVGNQLGASMIFATRSNNAGGVSERMRIHSNGFVGVNTSNPVYTLDVQGSVRSYLAGFVSDHAYTYINGQLTPQSNSVPAAQCAYGGFLSLRHLGKTSSNEVYDWFWINMKNVTNGNPNFQNPPNVASGLHLIPYGYYTTLHRPAGNQIANVRLVFSDNGRLGINTTNPAHTLTVIIPNTSITGSYQASGWQHSSDGRLKTNIRPLTNALEKVLQLRGVNFTWKNNPESGNQIGFIAQEVKQVVPELVSGTEGDIEKGETLSMSYGNLTPLLVEAIKEQQKIIADLQRRVALLESQQQNNV
jgi:hypothetical protein